MEVAALALALPALFGALMSRADTPAPAADPPAPAPATATPAEAPPRMQPTGATLRLRMGLKSNFYVYPAVPPVAPNARAVLFFSGDWGWKPVLQETATYLAMKGRTVVGIDSTDYFSRVLEGSDWSRDLKALRTFANEKAGLPADTPVLFVGYTWGATMLPFMFNRGGVEGVAGALLIGPDFHSNRIFRVTLQMPTSIVPLPPDEEFLTTDEVARLAPIPVVLMQGAQDMESAADQLLPMLKGPKQIVNVPGGDRQFHDVRDIYFSLTAQALGWLEGRH
jgi:hypothetical protein